MADIKFTKEEASYIDKKLGPIIFDWAKSLINHILFQAKNKDAEVVYMNTPDTLDAGSITEGKTVYFYEKLPPILGFEKETANLRGKGNETLWAYRFNKSKIASTDLKMALIKLAKLLTLEQIPPKYQGAFIQILGRKDSYTLEEAQQVIEKIEKNPKKKKATAKYYYDWTSKTWSGAQTFKKNITENVVLQKMTSEMQSVLNSDDTLRKFWSYILSHHSHFGSDVVGFGLVSKISPTIWVINEIQTDCLNHYMELRKEALEWNSVEKENDEKRISWDTLMDMLTARNKTKWIAICETNEAFKQQLLQNPNMIDQLPDDSQDIQNWISENQRQIQEQGGGAALDIIRHFQSVNFNTRIFRTY